MSASASHARRWVHISRAAALSLAAVAALSAQRFAAAEDLFVSSAAVDQPRINVSFAPAGNPSSPFFGDGPLEDENGDPIPSIQINAYWDTGASGIVLSEAMAQHISMSISQHNGQDVVFSDVSPGGPIDFNVSEPLVMRIGPSVGIFDGETPYVEYFSTPGNFTTSYEASGPVPLRAQIGPIGALDDINVIGMPSMIGRKVVWDPRPTDNTITLLDEDPDNDNFDAFMRSYSYPGTAQLGTIPGSVDPERPLLNAGIPTADVSVSLSYADFGRFTDLNPPGATGPNQTYNPFLGPNPLDGPQPGDGPAPILRRGALSMTGSWLLDSGAAASFISQQKALDLNVEYSSVPGHELGSDDPQLVNSVGALIPNQFQIPIQGISGEILFLAGFYADSLTIPTDQGDPDDPNDPNHLHYVAGDTSLGAPVLVFDITLQNPDDPEDVYTLDGIFGMNFMAASVDGDFTSFPPPLFNFNLAPFDGIVFDEPGRTLYFSFNDGQGWPVPEPGAALVGLGFIGLLLSRRRSNPLS